MRTITVVIISILIGLTITVTVVAPAIYSHGTAAEMPDYPGGNPIIWKFPVMDDTGIVWSQVYVPTPTCLTDDDFKAAFDDPMMTRGNVWNYGYYIPDCPAQVVDGIRRTAAEMGVDMDSCPDRTKCIILQSFVTTGIEYRSDDDLYGCPDYAATPTETLYLRMGDCEDASILFVSLARAFGIDSTLMILDGHCMAGVRIAGYTEDADGYSAIECTTQDRIWGLHTGTEEEIRHVVTDGLPDSAATAWMRYSNAISDYNPILFILRMFS